MKQLLVLIFLFSSMNISSQDKNYNIDTIQINSEILKENRSIIIYKSQNISPTDSVKFIYLIDGEFSNYRYQSINEHFKDTIINLVAVGIVNTDRRRDLLNVNAADKFLDFVTSELIPVIEKDYKTKSRILYGHSFGGGFTIYAMINKPNYFNYYIASSPTPIMDLVKKENYLQMDSLCKHKIVFYLSFGSRDLKQVSKWSNILNINLTGMELQNLDWRFKILEDLDHNNSDISALMNALNDLI